MEEFKTAWNNVIRRGRDVLEMPVYSISEGKSLGVIDTLYVQRETLSVTWVRLRPGSLSGYVFLPYSAFKIIGVDAALVSTERDLCNEVSAEERPALDTGLSGRSVLTQAGEIVGHLTGFAVDTSNGGITAFRVRPEAGFLRNVFAAVRDETVAVPVEAVASLGPDAVILGPEGLSPFRPQSGHSEDKP